MTRGALPRSYGPQADDRSICCPSSAQKQVDRAAIDPAAIAAADYGRPGTGRAFRGCGRLPILGRWRSPWASGRCCRTQNSVRTHAHNLPVSLSLHFPFPGSLPNHFSGSAYSDRGRLQSTPNKVSPQQLPLPQTATSPPRPRGPPRLSIPPRALHAPAGRFLALSLHLLAGAGRNWCINHPVGLYHPLLDAVAVWVRVREIIESRCARLLAASADRL